MRMAKNRWSKIKIRYFSGYEWLRLPEKGTFGPACCWRGSCA